MYNSKGLSLIEAAVVLVLAAIVTVGVMYYYNSAKSNYELNSAEEMIAHIQQRVLSLYQNSAHVDDTLSLSALHLGIKTLPDDPNTGILPGGIEFSIQNSWNAYGLGVGDGTRFYIILKNITPEQCAVLSGAVNGISGPFIGSYIYKANYKNISELPLNERLDYCAHHKYNYGNDDSINLGLIFRIR